MELKDLEFQAGIINSALPEDERAALLSELNGWQEDGKLLTRTFAFANFVEALEFANRVGDLAESFDHHPEIVLEYGKATVKWWTHTADGIASNDFLLARETSALYPEGS